VGTEGSRITFTSYQDDTAAGDTNGDGAATAGAPGQWFDISFGSSTSQLAYVDVRYGGYGSARSYAPIYVYGSGKAVALDHATITNSQRSAIVVGGRASVNLTNSTLSTNQYGLYVDLATATVDNTTIANNGSRGVWFNLPTLTPLPPATSITNSDISGNAGYGIYIGANGDYPFVSLPHGSANNIFGNNGAGVQLRVNGYPSFGRADVDWRDNYWGEGVYFWYDNPLCTSTSPYSPGHLAYSSSTGNVPGGPIDSGTYFVSPDLHTIYWCVFDSFKIDPCQFSATYITGDFREIDFAEPQDVGDALSCAQQAGLTPVQLESDYSGVCADLRVGYIVDPEASTADLIADYEPMIISLFDEFNSFQDVACSYPGTARVSTMRVETSTGGPNNIPITPYTCTVPESPWWPATGKIETGPSWMEPYASRNQRYIYQTFWWTQDSLDNIWNCDSLSHNWTYEPDAKFDNYDGLHYFGRKMSWASNLPRKYNDTRWLDSDNEPTYTVGTADAFKLQAGKTYFTLMRTKAGNASTDRGTLVGQIGRRVIGFCYSTWCIDPRASEVLVSPWDVPVPGARLWAK